MLMGLIKDVCSSFVKRPQPHILSIKMLFQVILGRSAITAIRKIYVVQADVGRNGD